jgi:riboflavin kinase
MAETWFALFTLANLGADEGVEISSIEFAEKIGSSQQTASRRLKELEKKGLVTRIISHKGQSIRITRAGIEVLQKIYLLLHSIFEKQPQELKIEGQVFSGMGEGAYYITQQGYANQFMKKLGFSPYPGTLNLRITKQPDLQIRKLLESDSYKGIEIEGFKDQQRTYGPVKCFLIKIEDDIPGAILLIQRTHHHENVLEIVAPKFLRDVLKLKDGDPVRITIKLTNNNT